MLLHCHSYFSLRYGLMSPEDIVRWAQSQADILGEPICVLLADINNVSGASNFQREAKKHSGVIALTGAEIRNGDESLYVLVSKNQNGFSQINQFLTQYIHQNQPFPVWAPALSDVQVIYTFKKASSFRLKDISPPNALLGVTHRDIRQLPLSQWRFHPQRLIAYHRATLRTPDDFHTHTLLRCIDHNCLLTKLNPLATCSKHEILVFMHELKKKFALYAQLWQQSSAFQSFRWTFEFDIPQNKKTYTGDSDEDYRMMRDLAFEGLKYRYPKYTFQTTERLEKEMKLIYELGFTAYFLINWDICRFARERGFFYVGRGSGANSMVAYCLRITDVDPIDLDLYFERFINPFRSSPPDFDIDFSWQDRDTVTEYILTKYGNGHSALLATYNTFQTNAVVRELGKVYGLPKAEIDALLERQSYFSPKEFEQFLPEENTVKHSRDSVYSTPGVGQRVRNRVMRSSSSSSSSSGSSSSESHNSSRNIGSSGNGGSSGSSNSSIGNSGLTTGFNYTTSRRNITYEYDSDTPDLHQDKESLYGELLRHAQKIHNLPNYRSLHVGGILISEKPLYHFSALDLPPKGFPSVQFSMLEAEDLNLAKFDILSQRGLGHIKDAVIYVRENRGIELDIHRIQEFKNDPKIARIIAHGNTMGCFYVESPAMRQLLRKLRCQDYLTLVAASSVIRPGVARSGMMRTFIERHIDPKKRQEAHPIMQSILPETYGIMVYQEDVIRVASEFAGLGLAESDVLRRGMSGKFRSREEFQKVKDQFFSKALAKKHPTKLIHEVWHQIESFAGYSFAKGHSASYAVESYQSLHLKTYYPLEFYTAVINNFGGFYRTEFYVHAAKMCGADVKLPCVQNSGGLTRIKNTTIWLGLGLIQGMENTLIHRIEVAQQQPFIDLDDFKNRCHPGLEQLKLLIQIGALRFTNKSRKALLWDAHALYAGDKKKPSRRTASQKTLEQRGISSNTAGISTVLPPTNLLSSAEVAQLTEGFQPVLFKEKPKEYELPSLEDDPLEVAIDQRELLGFTLVNPFELIEQDTIPESAIRGRQLSKLLGKSVYIEGRLVTVKPTKTVGGKEMNFGTWLDRDGYFFDSVHFPPVVARYPFKGRGIYRLWGVVIEDFGVVAIEIAKMEKLGLKPDPRS